MSQEDLAERYAQMVTHLQTVADREIPMPLFQVTERDDKDTSKRRRHAINLDPEDLQKLSDSFPHTEEGSVSMKLRLERLEKENSNHDPLALLVRNRMVRLGLCDKKYANTAAGFFLLDLPFAAITPREYSPTPTSPELVLKSEKLTEAVEAIGLSDPLDSVAKQLLDPIGLSNRGLALKTDNGSYEEELNKGFILPLLLFDILRPLKYQESEGVFRGWLEQQFYGSVKNEPSENALKFLNILANFTVFLDSGTHLEMWGIDEKTSDQGNDKNDDILRRPFLTLLNLVRGLKNEIPRENSTTMLAGQLSEIEDLIWLRYGEVYRRKYRTTLHTDSPESLTMDPQDFAEMAMSFTYRSMLTDLEAGGDHKRIATGLVRLAESSGVKDLSPLLNKLVDLESDFSDDLYASVFEEAQKRGIIEDHQAVKKTIALLKERPWYDAADIDFSKIIRPNISDLSLYVFTGTFGPFHRGHKHTIETLLEHIYAQESEDKQGLLLVMPVTNIANIRYGAKKPASMGTLYDRVSSILLQTVDLPRDKLFITTALQPHPELVTDVVGRIRHTGNRLFRHIADDLEKAHVMMEYQTHMPIGMGPDELKWNGQPRKLAPPKEQPRKVIIEGGDGVLLARGGWLSAVVRNGPLFKEYTSIKDVLLTPTNPQVNSSTIKEEIALLGTTQGVEPAARGLVARAWHPNQIEARQQQTVPSRLPLSVGDIYYELINDELITASAYRR